MWCTFAIRFLLAVFHYRIPDLLREEAQMRAKQFGFSALVLAALLTWTVSASAQQGTLTGRATNAEDGTGISQAQIQVLGGAVDTGVLSDDQGNYRIAVAAGTYDLVVTVVGYRVTRFDNVRVSSGETTTLDMVLLSRAQVLDPIVVTASRGTPEKSTEAVATVHRISSVEISERPAPSLVDHLRSAPGVDIITYGLQASNVTVRGFNNIFSGALHMLTDHRLAGVPSLRVNLMHFIPSNEADIDRMEVVLGPGSALYGPNTANGVVHILTKSPLESQGTTVTLGGGERSVFQGSFRSAFLLSDDLGVKVSGQYLRGDEWEFADPTEAANRAAATSNPATCLADKAIRGVTGAAAQAACDRIGIRDFDIERYGLEARADWRFADNGTFVATYGRNNSSGIELTGLGAGQTKDWTYEFYQARVNVDRFFAQAYVNRSDAGSSYLLNSGVPLVDRSKISVGQLQHGFDVADGRQDFTYGFDFFGTRPNTQGQINGIYEADDSMDEWGVYLQSKTALSDKVDLVLAGRLDSHSILPSNVFSPRAGLVVRPTEQQSFRFAYNRAYSSPSSLNYFLDLSNGFAPGGAALGYGLRAFGTGRTGWSLQNTDGSLKGFRSPFNPGGPSAMVPIQGATQFWGAAIAVLQAQVAAGALPADLAAVLPVLGALTPTPADIGAMLFHPITGELVSAGAANLPAVPSIEESNTETFEVGWTGIIDQRLRITADLYYSKKNNFVSPLMVQTPFVTLNGQDVGAFITVPIVTAITQQLIALGLDPATAQATAAAQAGTLVPLLAAGIAQVPVGVISSDEISGGSDLVVTYRNVGDLTLWGSDFALQWFLDDSWMLSGTYSRVSDDTFLIDDGDPISLNAPKNKGSLALAYRNALEGFNAEARVRFNSSFSAVSAGFSGEVPSAKVVDLHLGYDVPSTAATLQLSMSNIFDAANQAFVGVPNIGRFLMLRVKYDLF
jgi:outer membrane receptor for ferrienterochelin and colicins